MSQSSLGVDYVSGIKRKIIRGKINFNNKGMLKEAKRS